MKERGEKKKNKEKKHSELFRPTTLLTPAAAAATLLPFTHFYHFPAAALRPCGRDAVRYRSRRRRARTPRTSRPARRGAPKFILQDLLYVVPPLSLVPSTNATTIPRTRSARRGGFSGVTVVRDRIVGGAERPDVSAAQGSGSS